MFFLPELRSDNFTARIPVSVRGAAELAWGLLEDGDARCAHLADVLPQEPGLALWVVCRAGHELEPNIAVVDVAHWLAGAAEMLLVDCEPITDGRTLVETWMPLALQSVAVARRAVAGKSKKSAARKSPAYLLGLLHNSASWLAGAQRSDAGTAALACLPGWLADSLKQLESGHALREPLATIAAAVRRHSRRPPKKKLLRAVSGRWISTTAEPSLAAALPRLARVRGRLGQLESDFDRVLEQEKLASLRQLAYGASHEINNPLANISTRAQTLLRDETDPDRRRKLATIGAQAFRAHEMISDMMLFAKPPQNVPRPIDVQQLVSAVIGELTPQAEAQGTLLRHRFETLPPQMVADDEQLSVALAAMLRNSIEAIDLGGQVEVCGRGVRVEDDQWLELTITDTGPGISDEVRRHLFDPFFSGREAGRGLGLGLSKCWRIVTLHGGTIDVENVPLGGARFTLRLPSDPTTCPNIRTAG